MILFNKIIVLIFLLTFTYGSTRSSLKLELPEKCELSPLDLVFVVDMSGSIGKTNYYQSMESLSKMINESLEVGQSVSVR